MDKFFTHIPKIIETAAKSPLGLFALMVLSVSALGFMFFHDASEILKAGIFVMLFSGVCAFGYAVMRSVSRQSSQPDSEEESSPKKKEAVTLRRKPALLSADQIKVALSKHGLYEKRWNPGANGVEHRYQVLVLDDALVIVDEATGLMWQKGGSRGNLTFDKAEHYATQLNAERFAGFNDWRLPTVEEAMSLMEPKAYDNFHIDPHFERGINFIWTADNSVDDRAWLVYFYDGILAAEKKEFNAWSKLVRCL